jgi:uncharacterized protein YjiS (DUF1127 family)
VTITQAITLLARSPAYRLLGSWLERRRQRRELLGLSDAMLEDIGLSRCDAWREPFWWPEHCGGTAGGRTPPAERPSRAPRPAVGAALLADGRGAAFESSARNLVPGNINTALAVLIRVPGGP